MSLLQVFNKLTRRNIDINKQKALLSCYLLYNEVTLLFNGSNTRHERGVALQAQKGEGSGHTATDVMFPRNYYTVKN